MKAAEFYSILFEKIKNRGDITIEKFKLQYKKNKYDFLKIASKEINANDKMVLIRAGIHGDEVAGPLTILKNINEIIECIHKNNLKVIFYPLGNPSGFEMGKRYNIDDDKGECGNNDFLRYRLEDRSLVDDLGDKNNFKKWLWSSDKSLSIKLPKETVLMHKLLKKEPISQIVAVIDLHQDYITPGAPPAAYQYVFGDTSIYKKILQEIKKILPLYKNRKIDAGQASPIMSDEEGFVVRHDGTLPDLMYRLGIKYCVTVETTGSTPINIACKINLFWIYGIIEILSKN